MIKIKLNKFICFVSLIMPIVSVINIEAASKEIVSQEFVKEKMCADLDIIKHTFEVMYAPAEWKKNYNGWDLNEQIGLAKESVQAKQNITMKDFHQILKKFFNSPEDLHVGIHFHSTEQAAIPIRLQSVNGRYFIAFVSKDYCDYCDAFLQIGDEVLEIDGRPIDEAVQEFKLENFSNTDSPTYQSIAESSFLMRLGASARVVPQGSVVLTIRETTGGIIEYELPWLYTPEDITPSFNFDRSAKGTLLAGGHVLSNNNKSIVKRPLAKSPFFDRDMTVPFYKNYLLGNSQCKKALQKLIKTKIKAEEDEDDFEDTFIGDFKSPFPALGKVIWEASPETGYHAYIFITPERKKVGYIRIPNYVNETVDDFVDIMNRFQARTDLLVIDQINNPGGNVLYMYALASALIDKPLKLFGERMSITQDEVFFAHMVKEELESIETDEDAVEIIGEDISGYPVNYVVAQQILSYINFVIDEWNAGRSLTNYGHLLGIDSIQPNPNGRYTKPILILVNELDISCGDFFPAFMQDNGRATLLGVKTAGAGGCVYGHTFPNLFGIAGYSFTGSIAKRKNQQPLENLGVTPDIIVELTERDLIEGYPDYIKKVNEAIKSLR